MRITKSVCLVFALLVVSFVNSCATGKVPIGGVVDWYRPNSSFPIPDGYMIADGSIVTDSESPLLNEALPDLRSKFVRGAAALNEIGATGGLASHSHGVNMPTFTTSQVAEGSHRHQWAKFDRATNKWTSFSGNSEIVLVDWGDGLDSEGSGVWPLGFDEENRGSGTYPIYLNTGTQGGIEVHRHNVEVSGNFLIETSPNEPPYVMLLKIVRIK
jgi:hypothetical protein